ncbi:MAG: hypothetical protein ABIP94_03785 [Planctomycetota bacterium]
MRSSTATSLFAASLLAACAVPPSPQPPYAARPVVELARWQVMDGETLLGYVRHLEIRDPKGPLPYYRVEDAQGRWLGHASEVGRFSRRVPFQDDEEDLGVWPMARGVAKLFEASADVALRPMAVDADARPRVGSPR